MWPWGHLAAGYLLYTAYSRLGDGATLQGPAVVAVAVGTQLPDLVDKPLAWTFALLPSGRSLAHSLFAATVAIAVVGWYARRRGDSEIGSAFAIGYLSHLVTDGIGPFLAGDYAKLTYLGWPLLPPPDYGVERGFVAHLARLDLSSLGSVQVLLAAFVVLLWYRDGAPGLGTARIGAGRFYRWATGYR